MMKRLFISLVVFLGLASVAFPAHTGAYSLFGDVCKGGATSSTVCQEQNKAASKTDNAIYGKNGILIKAVNILAVIIGLAAVIVIIASGIRYITSSGDPNSISGAKNTIIYALVGVVVTLLARSIITLVINHL